MISWTLWGALHHPPLKHPLYQRALAARPGRSQRQRDFIFVGAFLLLGAGCAAAMLMRFSVFGFIVRLTTTPFALLICALLGALLYGATLTLTVCRALMQPRLSRAYELLCLLPVGAWGANWALCTGSLGRRNTLFWFSFALRLVAVTLLIGLLFDALLTGWLERGRAQAAEAFMLAGCARALAFGAAVYLGGVQAMVSAVLCGLALPVWLESGAPIHVLAAGLYIAAEMLIWLLTVLCVVLAVPALFDTQTPFGYAAQGLLPALLFVGLGEALNQALWRALRAIDASARHEFMTARRAIGGHSLR